MLVALSNAVKVESVPLNSIFFGIFWEHFSPMTQSETSDEWETADRSLAPPPRKVPVAFRLAELLPFRW
jgi:hypothetical protein